MLTFNHSGALRAVTCAEPRAPPTASSGAAPSGRATLLSFLCLSIATPPSYHIPTSGRGGAWERLGILIKGDPMTHSGRALRREPIDRRRTRLIRTLLAFPAAGIIGFGGTAVVHGVLSDGTSVASPVTPGPATDEDQTPGERPSDNRPEADVEINRVRAV